MTNKVTPEMIAAIKQEVAVLKSSNTNEILVFEKNLQELQGLYSPDNLNWSPDLDSLEIITMEKYPPLSSSIRRIAI